MRPGKITVVELLKVQRAALILEKTISNPITIPELAKQVKLPIIKFQYFFKDHYGVTPYTYLLNCRMKKAKLLLLDGKSLKFIATSLGYQTESNFCKAFRIACKESPLAWKADKDLSYKLSIS
jgi:AraC-like DNA-binding protein